MSTIYQDDQAPLPGFRFHPTDEELVAFYLRRKVEKKPISIEVIRQIDIYKYDPWDLAKYTDGGDKDWYFYCKRGRKYRNSIRPNRVTGSGFWKATGIDKPVYPHGRESHDCIGLKKTLVFYRGSAGKGTKTDWMMHEFRLPPDANNAIPADPKSTTTQEAEIWTLCRIFKRNVSNKKYIAELRETYSKHHHSESSRTCSMNEYNSPQRYISFKSVHDEKKVVVNHNYSHERNKMHAAQLSTESQPLSPLCFSNLEVNEFMESWNCDELRSVVGFALDPSAFL